MRHLSRMASFNEKTGMTCKNLAIVWAPNLLRFVLCSPCNYWLLIVNYLSVIAGECNIIL